MIPCKAKLIIYKSTILPHLTYCHLVWHNCRSSGSIKLERIEKRALRAVFNSHSESYENLLLLAELPSLLNRRLQDIAILMYKAKYGLTPTFNTINYGKHSRGYQGPYIWWKLDHKHSSNIELNLRKRTLGKKT